MVTISINKDKKDLNVGDFVVVDGYVLCQIILDSHENYCLLDIKQGYVLDEGCFENSIEELLDMMEMGGYSVKPAHDINIDVRM